MSEHNHPYKTYEGSPIWSVVETAIADLVGNQDIEETTRREYIVGYLVQQIKRIEGIPDKAFQRATSHGL